MEQPKVSVVSESDSRIEFKVDWYGGPCREIRLKGIVSNEEGKLTLIEMEEILPVTVGVPVDALCKLTGNVQIEGVVAEKATLILHGQYGEKFEIPITNS